MLAFLEIYINKWIVLLVNLDVACVYRQRK